MNVEIGNPAYKIYEGEQEDDVGELLDSDFTLDPDKVRQSEKPQLIALRFGVMSWLTDKTSINNILFNKNIQNSLNTLQSDSVCHSDIS